MVLVTPFIIRSTIDHVTFGPSVGIAVCVNGFRLIGEQGRFLQPKADRFGIYKD